MVWKADDCTVVNVRDAEVMVCVTYTTCNTAAVVGTPHALATDRELLRPVFEPQVLVITWKPDIREAWVCAAHVAGVE